MTRAPKQVKKFTFDQLTQLVRVENNPFGLNKCVYFDVSLSSSLTPYTFNTPVKLNDRAKFYTNVRQEDRKNKTKHLRLSGLYNTDRMV